MYDILKNGQQDRSECKFILRLAGLTLQEDACSISPDTNAGSDLNVNVIEFCVSIPDYVGKGNPYQVDLEIDRFWDHVTTQFIKKGFNLQQGDGQVESKESNYSNRFEYLSGYEYHETFEHTLMVEVNLKLLAKHSINACRVLEINQGRR